MRHGPSGVPETVGVVIGRPSLGSKVPGRKQALWPLLRASGQDVRRRSIAVWLPHGVENRTITTLPKGKKANAFCLEDGVMLRKGWSLESHCLGYLFCLLRSRTVDFKSFYYMSIIFISTTVLGWSLISKTPQMGTPLAQGGTPTLHCPLSSLSPAYTYLVIMSMYFFKKLNLGLFNSDYIEMNLIGSLSFRESEQLEEGKLLTKFSHLINWAHCKKDKKTCNSLSCLRIWSCKPPSGLGIPNTKLLNYPYNHHELYL